MRTHNSNGLYRNNGSIIIIRQTKTKTNNNTYPTQIFYWQFLQTANPIVFSLSDGYRFWCFRQSYLRQARKHGHVKQCKFSKKHLFYPKFLQPGISHSAIRWSFPKVSLDWNTTNRPWFLISLNLRSYSKLLPVKKTGGNWREFPNCKGGQDACIVG